MKKYLIIAILCLSFTAQLSAQTNDNIIWASLKVQKKINPKTSMALAPILRLNDDISDYQNFSIDISAKRAIAKGWSVQLLARTWFIPDATDRQFLWLDVAHSKTFQHFQLGNSVRYHWALDIKDQMDADFIRFKTSITLLSLGKIKPFIAFEPWFRLNGIDGFRQVRYIPGVKCSLNQQLSLSMAYWRQETWKQEPPNNFNIFVVTLAYQLDKPSE